MFRRLSAPAETAESENSQQREVLQAPLNRRTFLRGSVRAGVGLVFTSVLAPALQAGESADLQKQRAIREWYRTAHPEESYEVQGAREFYPYSQSTLQYYVDQESYVLPHQTEQKSIMKIADNIANRVAIMATDYVRKAMKEPGLTTAQALKRIARNEKLLGWYVQTIREELNRAGYSYREMSLLSTGMSKTKNPDSGFQIDCDLLTHVALHVAYRHDIPLAGACAPGHMYAASFQFHEFAAEMTSDGMVVTTHEAQKESAGKKSGASPDHFCPCDDAYMRASVVGNILDGIKWSLDPITLDRGIELGETILAENANRPVFLKMNLTILRAQKKILPARRSAFLLLR